MKKDKDKETGKVLSQIFSPMAKVLVDRAVRLAMADIDDSPAEAVTDERRVIVEILIKPPTETQVDPSATIKVGTRLSKQAVKGALIRSDNDAWRFAEEQPELPKVNEVTLTGKGKLGKKSKQPAKSNNEWADEMQKVVSDDGGVVI